MEDTNDPAKQVELIMYIGQEMLTRSPRALLQKLTAQELIDLAEAGANGARLWYKDRLNEMETIQHKAAIKSVSRT